MEPGPVTTPPATPPRTWPARHRTPATAPAPDAPVVSEPKTKKRRIGSNDGPTGRARRAD